jgi:hypothetical protein
LASNQSFLGDPKQYILVNADNLEIELTSSFGTQDDIEARLYLEAWTTEDDIEKQRRIRTPF